MSRWTIPYGGTVTEGNQVDINQGGGYTEIDSTSQWGQGNEFIITISGTAPTGTDAIGLYGTGAGTPAISVRNDSGSWVFDVGGAGLTESLTSVAAPAAHDVLQFVWTSNSVAYILNGSTVATQTTAIPTGVAGFSLACWNYGDLKIASVAVAQSPRPNHGAGVIDGRFARSALLCLAEAQVGKRTPLPLGKGLGVRAFGGTR